MQNKSEKYKRELKHTRAEPTALVEVCAEKTAFQKLLPVPLQSSPAA